MMAPFKHKGGPSSALSSPCCVHGVRRTVDDAAAAAASRSRPEKKSCAAACPANTAMQIRLMKRRPQLVGRACRQHCRIACLVDDDAVAAAAVVATKVSERMYGLI